MAGKELQTQKTRMQAVEETKDKAIEIFLVRQKSKKNPALTSCNQSQEEDQKNQRLLGKKNSAQSHRRNFQSAP